MTLLRAIMTCACGVLLVAGCGVSSRSDPDGDAGAGGARAGRASGGSAGAAANAGSGASADHGGTAGSATGGTPSGGAGAGAAALGGGAGGGGAGTGGNGATAGGAGVAGKADSSGGSSSAGHGGENTGGDGGSAGERAIECTGAMQYFPEFDRTCTTDDDCVAVAHQTSCCGAELVMGIRASEQAAFDAAEAICAPQYPACGCAAQGIDVEDGTQIPFAAREQVHASCDAGSCTAHYSGVSFACGTRRCTEEQYCVESSGGPAGTPTSYICNPTACTACSCLTMVGCTCSETDGHLTFACEYP